MGWRLSQFDILAQLAADRSNWITADDYPSTVLCRRILALADWAGGNVPLRNVAAAGADAPTRLDRGESDLSDLSDRSDRVAPGGEWSAVALTASRASRAVPTSTARNTEADVRSRWRVARLAFECPELSIPEIGVALDLDETDVRRALAPADLSDQTDRDALACPLYDEPPAHLFPPAAKYDPDHVSATYANGTWLAMYAAARPVHWRVWRLRWAGLTQQEIADKIGITQQAVSKYLEQPIRFEKTTQEEEEE